jgi:hypothetical protein
MKQLKGIVAIAGLVLSCGNNPGGTSDETVIRAGAVLYEPDGRTPAVGATVRVFVSSAIDGKYLSRQTTDTNGRYEFVNLAGGEYRLWAQKDSFVACQRIVVVAGLIPAIKNDTLQCPSTVSGIVALESPDNPNTVTGHVVGTDKRFTPDPSGRFTLKGLAAGTYSLLVVSSLAAYSSATFEITVGPCSQDTSRDTLRLFYAE